MIPSRSNFIIFVLSLAGCGLSLYLTLKYVQHQSLPCGWMHSDCDAVANDMFAKGLGISALKDIPTPAFGALMYAALAGLAFWRVAAASPRVAKIAGTFQLGIATAALAVSGALTWREATIHHWCLFCMASAAIVLLIFIISAADKMSGSPLKPVEAQIPS